MDLLCWCFVHKIIRCFDALVLFICTSMYYIYSFSHSRFGLSLGSFTYSICCIYMLSHALDYVIFNSVLPFNFITMLGDQTTDAVFSQTVPNTSNDIEINGKCDQHSSIEQLSE